MVTLLLYVLLVAAVLIIISRRRENRRFPGPPRLPILGSLPWLNRRRGLFDWVMDPAITQGWKLLSYSEFQAGAQWEIFQGGHQRGLKGRVFAPRGLRGGG